MKHYYLVAKEVGALTRIFCAALEEQHRRRPRFRFARLGLGRRRVDGMVIQGGRIGPLAPDAVRARADRHAAPVPSGAGARSRHSPRGAARGHPEPEADRPRAARGPGRERAVHGDPDLAQAAGDGAAADERGRRARPFPARVRPRRRADGAQPLPRLHGRRAHHPGDRRAARDRGRPARRRAAARHQPDAQGALAHRAVRRPVLPRPRQGARRRPLDDRRRDGAPCRSPPRPHRRAGRDHRLAGPAPPAALADRVQARHRGPQDRERPGRGRSSRPSACGCCWC